MTTLYDAYGRPIQRQALTRELAAPTLAGVRTIWNETVASGLTPQRLAALLMNAAEGDHDEYLTLAEEMEERDLHYACELGKRKLAVSRLPVTVEAASDSRKDVEKADAVRSMTKKAGFRWLLKDLLDGLGKGYSVAEIIWDRRGALWAPARYEHRDPRWFCFERVGLRQLRLRDEANMADGVELAPYKFITHMPRIKSGIPIRAGFARLAAWAYMCKGYTLKDWLAFAEVFGMPIRTGQYRPGASDEDIAILKMAVANLGTDAAGVFPEGMTIDLKEVAKADGTDFFERLAQFLDNQVTKGILGQTATTQGTPGKLGNEEAQKEVREDIRDDDAEQLEETLQRDLVRPFIDLNFGPQEEYPQIQLRAVNQEDIEALTKSLERMFPFGLEVEASVVMDKLGLPDPPEGAKVLKAPVPAAAPMPGGGEASNRAMARNRQADADDDIDAAVAEALGDWQPMMAPMIDPIRQALADSADRDDFVGRMARILDNQDPSRLVEHLAGMLFRARAEGMADEN